VTKDNLLYKCGWSPFEGTQFPYSIQSTFVNGHLVYHQGQFNEAQKGSRMQFTRS
jgi:dihydroorotase